jgi:hypothetical protein
MQKGAPMPEAIAVFLGPSLPVAQARTLLDAQYHPPARMGDIYRILGDVCAIVLIDGVFHSVPSIWHREILDALGEGVRVYGAASMGALRAAELHSYGMVGVGKVFGWYRDGVIDSDDEVTLLHGPEEAGYVALSEPLVNIRATLDRAVADGYLLPDQATILLAHVRQTHYTRRSFADMLHCSLLHSWPPELARRLTDYLRAQRLDIKRADAIAALQACADKAAPAVAPRRLPPTYGALWQGEQAQHSTFHTAAGSVGGADMLQVVAASPSLATAHLPGIAERTFARAWGAGRGLTGVGGLLLDPANHTSFQAWRAEYVARWQHERRIVPDEGWLRANGISAAIYRTALDERALADWLIVRFAKGSGRRMVGLWASAQGVHAPDGVVDESALSEWVLAQGPGFFGLHWTPNLALLRELQITGAAAQLAATLCIPEGI